MEKSALFHSILLWVVVTIKVSSEGHLVTDSKICTIENIPFYGACYAVLFYTCLLLYGSAICGATKLFTNLSTALLKPFHN